MYSLFYYVANGRFSTPVYVCTTFIVLFIILGALLERTGIDPAFYANRVFGEDELLPWDNIDIGVTKEFFLRERHRAYAETTTKNCRETCNGCGANRLGGERSCCPGLKK